MSHRNEQDVPGTAQRTDFGNGRRSGEQTVLHEEGMNGYRTPSIEARST